MSNTVKDIPGFKVNDILVCSYGYNCTLVSFYRVLRVTKASVVLQEIGYKFAEHDGYGQVGKVIPNVEQVMLDPPITRRFKPTYDNTGFYVMINKYAYAYLWDGKPVYYNSMD